MQPFWFFLSRRWNTDHGWQTHQRVTANHSARFCCGLPSLSANSHQAAWVRALQAREPVVVVSSLWISSKVHRVLLLWLSGLRRSLWEAVFLILIEHLSRTCLLVNAAVCVSCAQSYYFVYIHLLPLVLCRPVVFVQCDALLLLVLFVCGCPSRWISLHGINFTDG